MQFMCSKHTLSRFTEQCVEFRNVLPKTWKVFFHKEITFFSLLTIVFVFILEQFFCACVCVHSRAIFSSFLPAFAVFDEVNCKPQNAHIE